jgi:phosphoserine phosphatase
MGLSREHVLAVGDGENDICLLRAAGMAIAYQPKSEAVRRAARYVVDRSMLEVIALLEAENKFLVAG